MNLQLWISLQQCMRRMMGVNLSKHQMNVASNLDFSVLSIPEVKLHSWHGRGAKKQSYSGEWWYENDHSRVQYFSLHCAGFTIILCNQCRHTGLHIPTEWKVTSQLLFAAPSEIVGNHTSIITSPVGFANYTHLWICTMWFIYFFLFFGFILPARYSALC